MWKWTQRRADGCIILIAAAWGASYLMMKTALRGIEPFNIVALRFGIAFLVTSLIFIKKLREIDRYIIGCSAMMGFILFCIFSFLTHGLVTTQASMAGFLTSTTVVFVPVIQILLTRKHPPMQVIVGIFLTVIGVALQTIQGSLSFNMGDLFCLVTAFLYACHILIMDRLINRFDGLLIGICQLGFVSLYAWIASFIFELPCLPGNSAQWGAIMGLALFCSAFGFVMQPVAQKYTTPAHTGLMLSLEPVFAAVFAFIFLREQLSLRGYVGAFLILCGIVITIRKSDK